MSPGSKDTVEFKQMENSRSTVGLLGVNLSCGLK